ncbi:hypothetical protein FHW88_005212 [Mucilaginibacter sp. SG538B]|uniref:hypothetical protein n=1 Tax=Mucilaginibacter sp. SG538B TaxID=2587021 RepID=UPI00159E45BB|nr:hypothetical protein [Mucilaginibacter sp. SG538B]NVM66894.1 hypothetical protein [Mucilaginibacter sp. SG538B]
MKELRSILRIKKFTGDPAKYAVLQKFWAGLIKELTGTEPVPYVDNVYANGQEILDGNPILTTVFKDQKALRIIQLEKDPEEPIFAAWTGDIKLQNTALEELVVSLQLRPDTYTEVRNLTKLYVTGALTASILQGVNEKYEANWNLEKLGHAVHQSNYEQLFNEFLQVNIDTLQSGHIDLAAFKRFDQYYSRISWQHIMFTKQSPLKKTYISFSKNITDIHDLISIHQTVDLRRVKSGQRYLRLLSSTWTPKQYITKLHNYSQRAEEEFDYLKEHVPEVQE